MDLNIMSSINSALDLDRVEKREQEIEKRNNARDNAIYQTMTNTAKQNQLLEGQLIKLQNQIELLESNNKTLQELYENAKKDSESSKKVAKKSNIISIVAIVVYVISIITSILISVLL